MKPHYVKLEDGNRKTLNVISYDLPHFGDVWHFHSDYYELTFIIESEGKQFIGDSIENFKPNDLILIGPNLPHMWENNEAYYNQSSGLRAKAIVTHFQTNFAGNDFLKLPETKLINELLQNADRGLKFSLNENLKIKNKILRLSKAKGINKLQLFISILNNLSKESQFSYLSSLGFVESFQKNSDDRLNKVFEYIMNNFTDDIKLSRTASIANMTKTSFCRYFKSHTRKTFTRYVNEIRIGYACKLLIENKLTIAHIGFLCGFNNLSNFNRQFKKIRGMTPSDYRKKYIDSSSI